MLFPVVGAERHEGHSHEVFDFADCEVAETVAHCLDFGYFVARDDYGARIVVLGGLGGVEHPVFACDLETFENIVGGESGIGVVKVEDSLVAGDIH